MNVFSLIAAVEPPGGLWTILINGMHGGIANFGWTILILVVLIKLVCAPLDFAVKYTTKKQNLIQQKCAPQVEKIKKKFGRDQNSVRIQTQSLYKREGLKTGVGCLVMLLNLVLTMVIFFTFYDSLRKNSAYQMIREYEVLETNFNDSFYSSMVSFDEEDDILTIDDAIAAEGKYYDAIKFFEQHESADEAPDEWTANEDILTKYEPVINYSVEKTKESTLELWNETKANWLWIDNIWVSDSTTSPFPSYEALKSSSSNGYSDYFEEHFSSEAQKNRYETIANIINKEGKRSQNGYYILAVLAAVVTFLSQYLTELHTKLKNKKANIAVKAATDSSMGFSMKLMKIILPIIMLTFVLTTSASFGIYILASNIASIGLGEIINLIVNKLTKRKQQEVEAALEKEANRMIKKGKLQEK